MVDFSLTQADELLVAMMAEENAIARKYARWADKNEDVIPPRLHPDVADREEPSAALERLAAETSGKPIAFMLMLMQGCQDMPLRTKSRLYLGSQIVNYSGSPEQIAKYGKSLLSIALTEPGAGSDPSAISASAKYDPATDEWILNGEKIYCSLFGGADGAVVMVKGDAVDGKRPFKAFIVTKDMPGLVDLGQVKKMGIRSGDTADFAMQDVRVPTTNLLAADFGRTMTVFNSSRPMVAAIALGISRSLLDFTTEKLAAEGHGIDYAKGRNARSIIEDKVIRMEALWSAAMHAVLHVKWQEQIVGSATPRTKVGAAVAKAMGGKAVRQIAQGCMELLGPKGLSEEHLAEKWFRDGRIYDIFEGAGEINRIIIARDCLGYTKKELN